MDTAPQDVIEQAEFFRCLRPEHLARIRPALRERRYPAHKVLFFEGQVAESLWVLRAGRVRLYRSSREGRITTLETLGPGQVFGALSAIEQEASPVSAETLCEIRACRLPRRVFLGLLAEDPRLGIEVLHIVSERLRRAQGRMLSLAQEAAPARLARALLEAAPDGEALVTRRALAEVAGTTVETAIRVLRRFEREGVIHGEVGRIEVRDRPGLCRLAGEDDG